MPGELSSSRCRWQGRKETGCGISLVPARVLPVQMLPLCSKLSSLSPLFSGVWRPGQDGSSSRLFGALEPSHCVFSNPNLISKSPARGVSQPLPVLNQPADYSTPEWGIEMLGGAALAPGPGYAPVYNTPPTSGIQTNDLIPYPLF